MASTIWVLSDIASLSYMVLTNKAGDASNFGWRLALLTNLFTETVSILMFSISLLPTPWIFPKWFFWNWTGVDMINHKWLGVIYFLIILFNNILDQQTQSEDWLQLMSYGMLSLGLVQIQSFNYQQLAQYSGYGTLDLGDQDRSKIFVKRFQDAQAKTVLMIGDSLIAMPCEDYRLKERIVNLIPPQYNVELINEAHYGELVASVLSNTPAYLEKYKPWAVIFFGHADISDIDQRQMTQAEQEALKINYGQNITALAKIIRDSGAHAVFSGPEILGEGPYRKQSRFMYKTAQEIDEYLDIIRNAATSVPGTEYINIREPFLKAIPWWWKWHGGWVTKEGEHPNDRGTGMEAKLFADQLTQWMIQDQELK